MAVFDAILAAIRNITAPTQAEAEQPEPQHEAMDVERRLDSLAQVSDAHNWRGSIVDLLKLARQDYSYTARRKLAEEMGIKDYGGTVAQNIAPREAVMKKLRAGGIKLPE